MVMNLGNLARKLEGVHTLESISENLGVEKTTAANYVSMLRKKGYVKTRHGGGDRIYSISSRYRLGGTSYVDVINKHSPIKVTETVPYKVYGRDIPPEEALIFAIKTGKSRFILAALSLFKTITDWTLMNRLAKENGLQRQIGALYDLSRKYFRTRKMSAFFRKSALPDESDSFVHIIDGFESEDFTDIQERWKVYVPFNKEDLEELA